MNASVFLVIAFITGLISAAIARGKKRNPFGWFLVGALLGLIGILICALQSPASEDQQLDVFRQP